MKSTAPVWNQGAGVSQLTLTPLASADTSYDVIVVGAGITGLTAAYLLKQAGKRVAVLEAHDLVSGVTGETTAHLTQIIDTRYYELESKFGRENARLVASSNRDAIDFIETTANALGVPHAFQRVPGFLFAEDESQRSELQKEIDACLRAGLDVQIEKVQLPFPTLLAMKLDRQGQLEPRSYCLALAAAIEGGGSHLFPHSPVKAIADGAPCTVEVAGGVTLTANSVIMATHSPLNVVLLQTKIAHYQSYVVSGPSADIRGLYWDLADPYHYIRSWNSPTGPQLIIGGADHKTGKEEDTESAFAELTAYAARFGVVVDRRWSSQVVEPVDGLPFIGRNAASKNVFVATGYSGNGMTFGTIAGKLLTDLCLERENPWAELYSATRIKPVASLGSFISENIDFPIELVKTAVEPAEAKSVDEVLPGEGKITNVDGKRMAVFRAAGGQLHIVSSLCTHLGCRVKFNSAATTWDCPCHGSQFSVDGEVLAGPATRPLERHVKD